MGTFGEPFESTASSQEEARELILQATADAVHENLGAYGPYGLLARDTSEESFAVELDSADPFGSLADVVLSGLGIVVVDQALKLISRTPDTEQHALHTRASADIHSNAKPGVYTMARLLEVLPKVATQDKRLFAASPGQLASIARATRLATSIAALGRHNARNFFALVSQGDSKRGAADAGFQFAPTMFQIASNENGPLALELRGSFPRSKDRKPSNTRHCPALHIRPDDASSHFITLLWHGMTGIAERDLYPLLCQTNRASRIGTIVLEAVRQSPSSE